MTAPATPGGTAVTLEELEQVAKPPVPAPKLSDIKFEGADLPEELKGKTAEDLLKLTKGAMDSLKLSERARIEAEARAAAVAAAPPPPAPVALVEEKELTKEELAELYQKDPISAITYMNASAEKRIQANFDRRLGSLAGGATTAAEQGARTKYADEFLLFGDQIKATIERLPDKSTMVSPKAWEDLISYIRGQPANFDKLIEHRASGKAEAARKAQQDAVGAVLAPGSPPAPTAQGALTDLEKEIARNLGMTEADYATWRTK